MPKEIKLTNKNNLRYKRHASMSNRYQIIIVTSKIDRSTNLRKLHIHIIHSTYSGDIKMLNYQRKKIYTYMYLI